MRRTAYLTIGLLFAFTGTGCITMLAAPIFLVGAAAAGIPLVLHLIHHRKAPEVRFPSLRFIRASSIKTARKKKIEDLLLLFLPGRVHARARPFFALAYLALLMRKVVIFQGWWVP